MDKLDLNMETVELEELRHTRVKCQYRDSSGVYGPKEYTFITDKEHFIGELVLVKDSKGYNLVRVSSEVYVAPFSCGYAPVVNLDEVNAITKAAYRKQEIASQIREAIIRNIENNAFDSLVKQYPDMAPMIEEYKASGGAYSDIMSSIVNMLK